MAKLSDLFVRKPGEAGPDARGGSAAPSAIETLSDVGSRMGEENEVLRNLLSDTGRKIGELDELKDRVKRLRIAAARDLPRDFAVPSALRCDISGAVATVVAAARRGRVAAEVVSTAVPDGVGHVL